MTGAMTAQGAKKERKARGAMVIPRAGAGPERESTRKSEYRSASTYAEAKIWLYAESPILGKGVTSRYAGKRVNATVNRTDLEIRKG